MIRSTFYAIKVTTIIARYLFRFFAGRAMNGERKTDATFWTPATRSLDPSGRMLRWERMRGAARAAWRLSVLYVFTLACTLGLLYGVGKLLDLPVYLHAGAILVTHLAAGGLLLAAYVTIKGNVEHGYRIPIPVRVYDIEQERDRWTVRHIVRHGRLEWEKQRVLPVAQALTTMLNAGTITPARARKLVSVPRDFKMPGGSPVVINLPASFVGDRAVQDRIARTVRARLGIREEISATWRLEGEHPRALISVPEMPPEILTYGDVSRYLEAIPDDMTFFHGIVSGGAALSTSLSGDSPHGAVSAGSGAGKSELLKLKIMQALHRGWAVIILDWKMESQEWARGLPGVRYVSTEEAIHDMCISIGEEIEYRKTHPAEERIPMLVVAEEWGITAPLLTEYWNALREPSDPKRSPALLAMMKLVFCGRAMMAFEELVAQRFSARVTNGNADLRESFQIIHMARWKPQTVKMLAPDVKPFPRNSKTPGRWVAVIGDEAQVYQAPLITDEEAREYALAGRPNPASPFMLRGRPNDLAKVETYSDQRGELGHDLAGPNGQLPILEGGELAIIDAKKLSDMADALESWKVNLNILRIAAKRDDRFPKPHGGNPVSGYTYDFYAIKEWAKRRHARMALERIEK